MKSRLHLNKRGIRVLGVAESFREGRAYSIISGVAMRGDLVTDGFAFGRTTVGGDDATSQIAALYRKLHRNDLNLVMLSGCIISKYNIVDVDGLSKKVGRPVVCLTYNETSGIESAIKKRFPSSEEKIVAYRRLGGRSQVKLSSGHRVFVRTSNMSEEEAGEVLNMFTLQGSIPEPVRVARLLARAVSALSSR